MPSDGGTRAITGFLFQVLVGGAMRAAGACSDYQVHNVPELTALLELARTAEVLHEVGDEDLALRQEVLGPTGSVVGSITLVQVKFSINGPASKITSAEMVEIINAFRRSKTRIEGGGDAIAGYVLVTNRTVGEDTPKLHGNTARKIYREMRKVEGVQHSTWDAALTHFAQRFGRHEDEIGRGRDELLGRIFRHTTAGGSGQGTITYHDLLVCLAGGHSAQELTSTRQSAAMIRQVKNFDVDLRGSPVPRVQLATIESDSAGRALIILTGDGGTGKTAALHAWAGALAHASASASHAGLLVALRTAHDVPREWLQELTHDWNPALRPVSHEDALERLAVANPKAVPTLHLALDGADEYPGDATARDRIFRLARWFWEEEENALQAGKPPRARLVVTCRNADEFLTDRLKLRRSGGKLSGGRVPLVVPFERFSEDEFRALLQANFPTLEAQLLPAAGDRDSDSDVFAGTNSSTGAASETPLTDLLRDPVMWRAFCLVQESDHDLLLAGDPAAEERLVGHFLDRFIEKLRQRTSLSKDVARIALRTIALENRSAARSYRTAGQWHEPAASTKELNASEIRRFFDEAVSGGLIRTVQDRRWDWRNDPVERYLSSLPV
jgi:hypothetical protein